MKIKLLVVKTVSIKTDRDLTNEEIEQAVDSLVKITDKKDTNFGIFVDDKIVYDYFLSDCLSNLKLTK